MNDVVAAGDKVHIVIRRTFEGDARRHFAGIVKVATDHAMRVEGYGFVHDSAENTFERSARRQIRVFSLAGAGHLITLLPSAVDIERLEYAQIDGAMFVTDGSEFRIGVNEFGPLR